jgi:hypothetical protein
MPLAWHLATASPVLDQVERMKRQSCCFPPPLGKSGFATSSMAKYRHPFHGRCHPGFAWRDSIHG